MVARPLTDFDPKDPSDADGFTFDLSAFLDGDVISGAVSAEISPSDITVQSVVSSGDLVTVWLSSGGTVWAASGYTLYTLSITFTTAHVGGTAARGPLKRSGTFIVLPR